MNEVINFFQPYMEILVALLIVVVGLSIIDTWVNWKSKR